MLGAPRPEPLAPEAPSLGPAQLSKEQLHPSHSMKLLGPASKNMHSGPGPTLSDVMAVHSTLVL